MFGRKQQTEPCEAFAAEEQHRGDGMVAYAAAHPDKDTRLWRECAQEAYTNAATHTAQPEDRPKRGRRGR